jgi:hypothetical protein
MAATSAIEFNRQKHTMELLEVRLSKTVGRTLLQSIELSSQSAPWVDGMLYELSAKVLADQIAKDYYEREVAFRFPATPWQFFKQQHLPEWFQNRWPVKMQTRIKKVRVEFTRYATYPMANVAIPKDQKNLYFYEQTLGGMEKIYDTVVTDIATEA